MGADFPLILAGATGRDPATVPLLSALAATLGVGVLNVCGAHVNIPYSDPHSLGHAPTMTLPHLPDADVVLLLDPEVPWVDVAGNAPRPGARVFLVNADPLRRTLGWFHVDADLVCTADAATALSQLLAAARAASDSLAPSILAARQTRIAAARAEHLAAVAAVERAPAPDGIAPTPAGVFGALREAARGRRALWLNEAVSAADAAWNHIAPDAPGSMCTKGGTSIGWVLGAAVGAVLGAQVQREKAERGEKGDGAEAPELVVALSGDGNFLFGVPTAAFWTARRYGAAFLTVVLNNGGWAVRAAFCPLEAGSNRNYHLAEPKELAR